MSVSTAQVNRVGGWITQYAAARQSLQVQAAESTAAVWSDFDSWYDAAAVAIAAKTAAGISTSAQQYALGLDAEYVRMVLDAMQQREARQLPVPAAVAIRGGVDPLKVAARPAMVFRYLRSKGKSEPAAYAAAVLRGRQLAETDVMLASRSNVIGLFDRAGYKRYRRVIRPELSETGVCGLCVAAADRIYKTGQLLPIHNKCKCVPMMILGSDDPARVINDLDLKRVYTDAGSTSGKDLKKVRYTVNEHGELGPVLTPHGQHFRGPEDVFTDQAAA